MVKALDGIRVLEWGTVIQGPVAGTILGDLGAEVIKIEKPGGHRSRSTGTVIAHQRDMSREQLLSSVAVNRSKKSITIDLKQKKGQEIVHRLAAKADVFVTNFSKQLATRLDLDYGCLSRLNRGLIYATASGLGPKLTEKPYFDAAAQARSGLMMCLGDRDDDPSMMVGSNIDVLSGTLCAMGIVVAILARERLGIGQEIDTSLFNSAIWLQMAAIPGSLGRGRAIPKHSRTRAEPLLTHYQCKDGKWLLIFEGSEEYWHEFCAVMGLEHLENDPRFHNRQARRGHREECISILSDAFATKDRIEWLRIFREQKVGFLYEAVQDALDLPADPVVAENEYLVDREHPVLGAIKLVPFPVKFSETAAEVWNTGPELGEHTEQVLSEVGDYRQDEIEGFKEGGVV
ncbi:CaiB/BaiF CoA transferase family protein [Thermodesulfobacteriota bacterium]